MIEFYGRHPWLVGATIIVVLSLMLIRSIIRALQRWEIIPDPLLPEKWRKAVNKVEEKALEASADPKNYGPR